MFYRPAEGHPLPHNPFKAIVSPRPIGWISTRAGGADNLAPYSFFNAFADSPPQVGIGSAGTKDSLRNIRESGVFAVNIVGRALAETMNATSAPLSRGESEFATFGVAQAECGEIDCAYVADAPAVLECKLTQEVALLGKDNTLVLGEVIGIRLRDDLLKAGIFDVTAYQPVARLGYFDFAAVEEVFPLRRPEA